MRQHRGAGHRTLLGFFCRIGMSGSILLLLGFTAVANDPFALYPVEIQCADKQGAPVAQARVYAYSKDRMMLISQNTDLNGPAGVMDAQGCGQIDMMTGDWVMLGVGTTRQGRPWAVTQNVTIKAQNTPIKLASKKVIRLRWQGYQLGTELHLCIRPKRWPSWWVATELAVLKKENSVVETGRMPAYDVVGYTRDGAGSVDYIVSTSWTRKDNPLTITTTPQNLGVVTVDQTAYDARTNDVFLLIESPQLALSGYPIVYRMTDRRRIYLTPGAYRFRYYVEWETDKGRWHAEFANKTCRIKARQEVNYRIAPLEEVRPLLMLLSGGELQYRLDGVDAAGNRLDWISGPHGGALGQLVIRNEEGEETHNLPIDRNDKNWRRHEEPWFVEGSEYTFTLNALKQYTHTGKLPTRDLGHVKRPHITLTYPKSSAVFSQQLLAKRVERMADFAERFVKELYWWYGEPAPLGITCNLAPSPGTAGGSAGKYMHVHMDYLMRGDYLAAPNWDVFAHELGHSMHCIEPMHVFMTGEDRDDMGLYNESQASFLGDIGQAALFGRVNSSRNIALSGLFLYRLKQGKTDFTGDQKAQLHYLACYLHNLLGNEWARRYFEIAHKDPSTLRNEIRAQDWTPAEKILALFSIAAQKNLTPYFQGIGLEVGDDVTATAKALYVASKEP